MWALRMVQAVPGMALMAHGITKPFAIAGFIRALALPFAAYAAWHGESIAVIAAIGALFELNSLIYVSVSTEQLSFGLGRGLVVRTLFLLPVAIAATLAASLAPGSLPGTLAALAGVGLTVAACGFVIMPGLKNEMARLWRRWQPPVPAAA